MGQTEFEEERWKILSGDGGIIEQKHDVYRAILDQIKAGSLSTAEGDRILKEKLAVISAERDRLIAEAAERHGVQLEPPEPDQNLFSREELS